MVKKQKRFIIWVSDLGIHLPCYTNSTHMFSEQARDVHSGFLLTTEKTLNMLKKGHIHLSKALMATAMFEDKGLKNKKYYHAK